MKKYSLDEVMDLNTREEYCLFFVGNKIYNAYELIKKHPGGMNALITNKNKDVSKDYAYHSKKSHKMWKTYLFGKLY
uniref:Cytochrome b5 heme-binding domain-containing protein n=1 Tax=viral metagenome TaxID=1070528 RepID=A0A6C0KII0_9ZZZZ